MPKPHLAPGVPFPGVPRGLHPGRLTQPKEGSRPNRVESYAGALMGGAGPFSPSPVRSLDGRVGLDPKGLGKHVCWSGLRKRNRAWKPEVVRNTRVRRLPTATPQPRAQPCWGLAGKGARLRYPPGWKQRPLSFAATPSGSARNRNWAGPRVGGAAGSRVGGVAGGRSRGGAGPREGACAALPMSRPSVRFCACAQANCRSQQVCSYWPHLHLKGLEVC